MAHDVIHAPIVETVLWPDELSTQAFAARLAVQPALRNAFIALHGDLGAGKTTLVRHLLRAMGVSGRIKSPTYAVVEPYTLPDLAVWHFDFYRFNDPQEWEDAGFRDLFASPGLKLVEWPDKAATCLPTPDLTVQLLVSEEGIRQVTFNAHSEIGQQLMVAVGCEA